MKDEPREWIFTFGFGQHGGLGRDRFVRISGTFEEARREMERRFGQAWAFQYESEKEAGVERFELKELR